MPLIFDVFEADDLNGSALGTLTDAFDKKIRAELNGFGAGSFAINRHSSQVAWCEPDNLVRVKLSDAGSYVFAFFIGEGEDDAVSADEEGGEVFSRGGLGALAYLSRAIIYPPADTDGNRRWEDDQFGDVLNDLLDEAQTRGGLADMSWDFSGSADSDSVVWPSFDGQFVLPVGMDYLSTVAKLQSLGLEVWMQPDLTLSAYNSRGADKTGTVHFQKGVNIREGGTRRIHASPVKSRVIVQGRTSTDQPKYREVIHSATESDARIGRRESFTQYGASGANSVLDLAGSRYLAASRDQHAGPIQLGVYSATLVPFTDYSEGDTVALTIAGLYTASEQRISAITLEETESGEYDVTLDLGGIAYEALPASNTTGGDPGTDFVPGDVAADCSDCSRRVALLPAGFEGGNIIMARGQAGSHVSDGTRLAHYRCDLLLIRTAEPVATAINALYHEPFVETPLIGGDVGLFLDEGLGEYGQQRWDTGMAALAAEVTDRRSFWVAQAGTGGVEWVAHVSGFSAGAVSVEVDGTRLHHDSNARVKLDHDSPGPWTSDFTLEVDFTIDEAAIDGLFGIGVGHHLDPNISFGVWFREGTIVGSTVLDRRIEVFGPAGTTDGDTFAEFDLNVAYRLKWEHTYGGTSRAKFWKVGDAEPGWLVSRDASGDSTPAYDRLCIEMVSSSIPVTAAVWEQWWENLKFNGVTYDDFNRTTAAPDVGVPSSVGTGDEAQLQRRSAIDGGLRRAVALSVNDVAVAMRRSPNGQHVYVIYGISGSSPMEKYSRYPLLEETITWGFDYSDPANNLVDWNVDDEGFVYGLWNNGGGSVTVEKYSSPSLSAEWVTNIGTLHDYRPPTLIPQGGTGQQLYTGRSSGGNHYDAYLRVVGYIGGADWTDGSDAVVITLRRSDGVVENVQRLGGDEPTDAAQAIAIHRAGPCFHYVAVADGLTFEDLELPGLRAVIGRLPVGPT